MDANKKIRRPVRWTDFLVMFIGFIYNFTQIVEALASEIYELSIYHANQQTDVKQAWEEMAMDLETLEEDK